MRIKKPWNVFAKLRPKLREIYRFSPMRREAIKAVVQDGTFKCAICQKVWPKELAEVDHEPPLGSFNTFKELSEWANSLFYGPVQVVDKMCHKKKSATQRRKK